ncbi:MAG TPA: NAD(P)-dependent oxidoreductase [Acidimicrobiales bacterium]|nr:NAD(P)-dependent oxidoreductase [Acidimicrobiales bacterium]
MATAADRSRIAVLPTGVRTFLADAVEAGGGDLSKADDAVALVWAETADAEGLGRVLDEHAGLRWVQLPWAGVEPYVDVIRAHADRTWTCGKGVYAEPVAEHALALALAGLRGLDHYTRATSWTGQRGRNLLGARVTIVGGGGIAESLLRLLGPFECDVTVVRRSPRPMAGARAVVGDDRLGEALAGADVVVLALPLLPESVGLIDRRRLELLAPGACLVNVARGQHVVTEDLVEALRDGTLGSAGLDVTDPEPLPDGHPLWTLPNAIVTPHTGNTQEMALPLLSARITDNVRRWIAGEPLVGPVDPASGY